MSDKGFRSELFGHFARIGKALSSPARLELLYLLGQGEKPVEQLARAAGLSIANASQHLQQLKSARLVVARKQGQQVRYRLASEGVEELWQCLQRIGESHLVEVRELVRLYLKERDRLEAVSRPELQERVRRGEVVVMDVRPEDEYRAGHLPRAVSIPLEQLESRLCELPKDKEIVAYCRGPYCLLSVDAVELLRSRGFRARRLADGFPEWKAGRLPIEGGAAEASPHFPES